MTITSCPMCEWEIPGEQSGTIKSCAECGADLSRWTARRVQPPPIPVQVQRAEGGGFARQAATFSIAAPIVAIALNWFSREAVRGNRIGMMIVGCTVILLILSGFVLGIVALVQMKKDGREGVLGKAIAGVCINGLLIALMLVAIPVFILAVEHAKEIQRQRQEEQQR
jgi:hypothetical protein